MAPKSGKHKTKDQTARKSAVRAKTGILTVPKGAPRAVKGNAVRRSVSLDPDIDALAHQLAGSDFSSFVNEALRREIQRTQMLGLLRDLDQEFGVVSESAKVRAEEAWQARSRSIAER